MTPIVSSMTPIISSMTPIDPSMTPMDALMRPNTRLDGVKTTLKEWLDNPPSKEVDPEVLTRRTTNLATEMLKHFAKLSRQERAKRRKTATEGKETVE